MSTNLFWRPPPRLVKGECLGNGLKRILAKKLWDHDGSLSSDPILIKADFLYFLEGIEAVSQNELAKDARALIDAIEKYGEIEIFISG